MKKSLLRAVVSLSALIVILVRLIWPGLKIDAITLGLLIVALLPWLADLIKSAEFPGGWKIEFQDLLRAGSKIEGDSQVPEMPPTSRAETRASVGHDDPNLALVGLRIAIEDKIRQLAKLSGINSARSLMIVFNQLREKGIITEPSASGLHELIIAGNQAAHGATVDPAAIRWTMDNGPRILGILDQAIRRQLPLAK